MRQTHRRQTDDVRQTDVRHTSSLNAPWAGHNNNNYSFIGQATVITVSVLSSVLVLFLIWLTRGRLDLCIFLHFLIKHRPSLKSARRCQLHGKYEGLL